MTQLVRSKSCIVKSHGAGLFSLINKVITCAEMYEHVHVDLSGSYYGEGNVWNELFLPTEDHGGDVIEVYPHDHYTYKNPHYLYRSGHQYWRNTLHECWNRFTVRPEITCMAHSFVEQMGQPFTAIMVRSLAHAGEQMTGREPSLEEYADKINVYYPHDPVFVMSNNVETQAWFAERFNTAMYPLTYRVKSRDMEYHLDIQQTFQDAVDCLTEVLICSRARTLIHGISNLATGCLYINPQMESIYLP